MSQWVEVRVPAIGDFHDVEVIEVLVAPGDTVTADQSLITLESDKATMEIPAPRAGIVRELAIAVGGRVSEGSLILRLEPAAGADEAAGELADHFVLERAQFGDVHFRLAESDAVVGQPARRIHHRGGV